jgi:hypothetical protein
MRKTKLSYAGAQAVVLNLEPCAFFSNYNQTLLMESVVFCNMFHVYTAYICNVGARGSVVG